MMAYRPAEERYLRYGPAVQQHHNRYQAPPPTSTSYHPRPSRGGRPGRTPSYHFPEPRGPHLYGSSFPTREPSLLPPRHLFAGGGGRGPGDDGGNWSGEQYHREHDIHAQRLQPFPRERYNDQLRNFYDSGEESLAGLDIRSQLSNPHRLQESFHKDVEWGDSGFSMGGRELSVPMPLMQVASPSGGEVTHHSSYTGFDSRSWSRQTGSDNRFMGDVHRVQTRWPGDGLGEGGSQDSGMDRGPYELDWSQRKTELELSNFPPQHGFESNSDFSISSVERTTPVGRELLLAHHPMAPGPESGFLARSNSRRNRKKAAPPPPRPKPPPQQKRGRERGGRGRGRGGSSTTLDQGTRTISKSLHHPPSKKRESRSGERPKESGKKLEKKAPPVKKSPETLQKRNLRSLSQGRHVYAENSKGRPLSPRFIQERLGPHIPGSGSVQNRLGPPKKGAAGVHSRLGPEETSEDARESIHTTSLKNEEKLGSSEGIHFRLGPEDNRSSSFLSSTSIHSRLGPEDTPSASHSLLEGSSISEPLPPSTSVHSRLGPNTITSSSVLSGGYEISNPLSSEHIQSHLPPNSDHLSSSTLAGGLEISDPLPSERVQTLLDSGSFSSGQFSGRLDISDPLPSECVHSRLVHKEIGTDRLSSSAMSGGLEISELPSELVHSRLGDISSDPLSSCSLSGGLDISDPMPSKHVPSHLRPSDENFENSPSLFGASEEFGEPRPVDSLHSRFGPEESFDAPLYSETPCSHVRSDRHLSDSQSFYSSLGHEQSYGSGEAHFGVGSEISPLEQHRLAEEPMFMSDSLGDHSADNSRDPQIPVSSSPYDPRDLSLGQSTVPDITENHSQAEHFRSEFQTSQDVDISDEVAPVDDPNGCYVVIDDTTTSLLTLESSDPYPDRDIQTDKDGSIHWFSESNSEFSRRAPSSTNVTPKLSTSANSDFSSNQLTPQEQQRDASKIKTSQSQSEEPRRAPNRRSRRARRKSARAASLKEFVGESIPTLLKQKVVPPPAKKHKLSNTKGGPKMKTNQKNVSAPLDSTYNSSMPVIGYKNSSDGGQMKRKTASKDKVCESASKQKELAAVAHSGGVEWRGHEEADKASGSVGEEERQKVKVGVATVVRAEREVEEGELTDSECEDLVIDLDTSSSSLPPPRAIQSTSSEAVSVQPPAQNQAEISPVSATASKPEKVAPQSDEGKPTPPKSDEIKTPSKTACVTDQEGDAVDQPENQRNAGIACITLPFQSAEEFRSTEFPETEGAKVPQPVSKNVGPQAQDNDSVSGNATTEAAVTVGFNPVADSDSAIVSSTIPPLISSSYQLLSDTNSQSVATQPCCAPSTITQPARMSSVNVTNSTPVVPSCAGGSELPPNYTTALEPAISTEPVNETASELEMTTAAVAAQSDDETEKAEQHGAEVAEKAADVSKSVSPLPKDPAGATVENKHQKEIKKATVEDDIETASISSGEIVSSASPSPLQGKTAEDSSKDLQNAVDHHEKPSVSRKDSDWRDHRYFHRPPPSHRDASKPYWRTRSPIRHPWQVHGRRRSGPVDVSWEKWRSRSRSPSPVHAGRRGHSSRRAWRRYSPEEALRRRRHSRSLSRDRRVGRGYGARERRQTTDGGEMYSRGRRTRGSRSCDRMSDRGSSESSDEDLEVLELRKEAILSMLTDGASKLSQAKKILGRSKVGGKVEGDVVENEKIENEPISMEETEMNRESETEAARSHSAPEVSEEAEGEAKEDAKIEDQVIKSTSSVEEKEKLPSLKTVLLVGEESSEKDKISETRTSTAAVENTAAVLKNKSGQKLDESQSPRASSLSSQPSTSRLSTSSSNLQPAVKPGGKKARAASSHGTGKRVAVVGKSAVAGVARSDSGSRMGSPLSSCGSPAQTASGFDSGIETPRRASDARPPTSVKILPGSKGTWEIPEFHIQLAESDGEGSESESEASVDGVGGGQRAPTIDEIDSILGVFRREAEAKARSKEKVRDSSPLSVDESQKSPEVASPRVDLDALGMLPLQQQKEYLELKTKLALHAKKQREEEMAVKAKDKGKRPVNAGSLKKAKVVPQPEQVKLSDTQQLQNSSSSPAVETARSKQVGKGIKKDLVEQAKKEQQQKEEEQMREEEEEEERKKMEKRKEEVVRKRREEQEKKKAEEEEEKKKKEEQQKREEDERRKQVQKLAKKKKKCEMKIAELEGKIRSCRSQSEKWTEVLNTQTSSLAKCESEVEEHELKIELLLKQLELANTSRDKCKQQRTTFQNEIKVTRENISRHTAIIQDTQQLLIRERELLITLEGDHGDSTDMETVPMDIDSDGSKGEEEMEIVTSSDEEIGQDFQKSLPPPLSYETISDTDDLPVKSGSGPKSGLKMAPGAVFGGSLPGRAPGRGRGKRRRMSRSQRSRKSSLSVTHSAVILISDSDTEHSETSKQTESSRALKMEEKVPVNITAPPIPSSPPPITPPPPPPPSTNSPSLTTSPSSLLSLAARTLAAVTTASSPSKPAVTVTSSASEECTNAVALPKSQGDLVFTATLPIPPIDVEFLTDTDTASESGVPGPTPLVSSRDPMLSGIGSDDPPTSQGMGLVETPEAPPVKSKTPVSVPNLSGLPGVEIDAVASGACGLPEVTATPLTTELTESFESSCDRFPLLLPDTPTTGDNRNTTARSMESGTHQSSVAVSGDSTRKIKEDSSEGVLSCCRESESCNSDCVPLDSSPATKTNNPFIFMLKISKIESLSESSDAFSPVSKVADPPPPFSMMSPEHESSDARSSFDANPEYSPAITTTSPTSSAAESKMFKTGQSDKAPPLSSEGKKTTSNSEEVLEKDSSERFHSPPTKKVCETKVENESAISLTTEGNEPNLEEHSQTYEIESVETESRTRKTSEQSIFVAVIDPQPPQFVAGNEPTSSQQRKSSRKKEMVVEKRRNSLKLQTGMGGRVGNRVKTQVRKLPLSRSGSDTIVAIETTRNRRKSTPRRLFVPKTADSSPTFASKSPTSLLMGSPTLSRALQSTLAKALGPALENALYPSKSTQQQLAKLNSETVSRSAVVSPTLNRTLQHTLDQALSPVLDSLPSFRRGAGAGTRQVTQKSTVCREGVEVVQVSHDHKERSYDPGVSPSGTREEIPDGESKASKGTTSAHNNPSQPPRVTNSVSPGAKGVAVGSSLPNSVSSKPLGGPSRAVAKKSTAGKRRTVAAALQPRSMSGTRNHPRGGSLAAGAASDRTGSKPVATKTQNVLRQPVPSITSLLGKIQEMKSNLERQTRGSAAFQQVVELLTSKQVKPVQQLKSRPAKPTQPVSAQGTVGRGRSPVPGVTSGERGISKPVKQVQQLAKPVKPAQQISATSRDSTTNEKEPSPNVKQVKNSGRPAASTTKERPEVPMVVEPLRLPQEKAGEVLMLSREKAGEPLRLSRKKAGEPLRLPWEKAGEPLRLPREKEGEPVRLPREKAGESDEVIIVEVNTKGQSGSQRLSGMDDVVEKLGFRMKWAELQEILRSPYQPETVATTTWGVLTEDLLPTHQPEVVSESVMESVQNLSSHVSSGETAEQSSGQLQRFKPYSSPLLSLSSYRLNPNYRTQEKLSLSSLSHSNKINPMKIWCKFEIFGKCENPQCTLQHFRDITPSKSELVDDIIAYSPTLSNKVVKIDKKATKRSASKSSGKSCSYGGSLIERFSGKISDEQLLRLAAYNVNEAKTEGQEGGVLALEELRAQDVAATREGNEKTRRPPLYWEVQKSTETPHFPVTPAPTNLGDTCSKAERYFSLPTKSKATPTDPGDSAHFLQLARGARDRTAACDYLKSGLSLHPSSQELWVEYLERKSACFVGMSGIQDQRSELIDKALEFCPAYSVVAKCVEICGTVSEKSRCILKGYHAIVNKSAREPSLSLICVQLLLNHAYLHCVSGHLKLAVSFLKHSLGLENLDNNADENQMKPNSFFTGVCDYLSPYHHQLVYLSLVHILYTSTFPHHIFLSSPSSPSLLPLLLHLNQNTKPVFIPWSKNRNISEEVLTAIETLLTSGMSKCMSHSPSSPSEEDLEEAVVSFQYHLVLFQLSHRSPETARQSLSKLLSLSSHSARLWILAAQFEDGTSDSTTVLRVLEKARESELDSHMAEFYCCAVKLVMKQGADGCHGELLSTAIPWLRSCVCRYYDISEDAQHQLSLTDVTFLYRKLLGQMIPHNYPAPDRIRLEEERENLPFIWVAYCLLVQLSHHHLRGDYHHLGPEEAFESAVHSVNRPSHLRIVWLEYLTYLKQNAMKRKNSQTAFKAFSDCVYRCLVVMGTKQTTPTLLPGKPVHYHDYSFQEQVCDMFFTALPQSSKFTLNLLGRLVQKIPDSPRLITRFARNCLAHSPPSLPKAQAALTSFLLTNPHIPHLWSLAIQVELAVGNKREARWMYREAVRHNSFSARLWKEFLLFELAEISGQSPLPSSSLNLAQEVVARATDLGVNLTPTQRSNLSSSPSSKPPNLP